MGAGGASTGEGAAERPSSLKGAPPRMAELPHRSQPLCMAIERLTRPLRSTSPADAGARFSPPLRGSGGKSRSAAVVSWTAANARRSIAAAIGDGAGRLFAPEPVRDGAFGLEQRVVEQEAVELTTLDTADRLLRVEP